MPSRTLSLVIILFWLATTGWLCYLEFWPRFQPGDSLDLIDLEDEARVPAPIQWLVFKDNRQIGTARSQVRLHKSDGTYEMEVEYRLEKPLIPMVPIERMVSSQRVTATGALREAKAKVKASVLGLPVEVTAGGGGGGGGLRPPLQIQPFKGPLPFQPKALRVSENESVLNPMLPVNRLRHLYEGRTWGMPLANPLVNAVPEVLRDEGAWQGVLEAKVHGEEFPWDGRQVLCWRI